MKEEQTKAQATKKKLTKEIRNEERKRKRLKERAKQLTDSDLVAVLKLREEARIVAMASKPGVQNEDSGNRDESRAAVSLSPQPKEQTKGKKEPKQRTWF